jgi:hypothetical protein
MPCPRPARLQRVAKASTSGNHRQTLTEALGIWVALRRVDSVSAAIAKSGTPGHFWPGRPL